MAVPPGKPSHFSPEMLLQALEQQLPLIPAAARAAMLTRRAMLQRELGLPETEWAPPAAAPVSEPNFPDTPEGWAKRDVWRAAARAGVETMSHVSGRTRDTPETRVRQQRDHRGTPHFDPRDDGGYPP